MDHLALIAQVVFASTVLWMSFRQIRRRGIYSTLNNIPGPPSQTWWKGNMAQFLSPDGWAFHEECSELYGRVFKINGILGIKQLFVSDPAALQQILVKDQDIFEETPIFIETNRLLFGTGLFSTTGDHHRKQRKMLNPLFSTSRMRSLMPVFYQTTYKLRNAIASTVKSGAEEVEMLEWFSRIALELIGQGGFGYSFDSLMEGGAGGSLYAKSMKDLIPTVSALNIYRPFLPFVVRTLPLALRTWLVKMTPWRKLQSLRRMVEVMHRTSNEVLFSKRLAVVQAGQLPESSGQGKDIMSVLLKANMKAAAEDRLSETEILSQISTLTFAAMETTSGALARVFQLLAEHPNVQRKLRAEISDARRKSGDLSYDELGSLPYLDAVCRETLRLYPPVMFVSRTTRQDVVLTVSRPIKGLDGTNIHEVPLPANTNLFIGIMASNRDTERWGADALQWNPGRWLSPLPENVCKTSVPGVYSNMMTFLGGCRSCIGFKFSELEMKVVLSVLLETFSFSLSEKDIVWKLGISQAPTVKDSQNGHSQLPLKVELLRKATLL